MNKVVEKVENYNFPNSDFTASFQKKAYLNPQVKYDNKIVFIGINIANYD